MFLTLGIPARNYWLKKNIHDQKKGKAHPTIKTLSENSGTMGWISGSASLSLYDLWQVTDVSVSSQQSGNQVSVLCRGYTS